MNAHSRDSPKENYSSNRTRDKGREEILPYKLKNDYYFLVLIFFSSIPF